MAGYTRQSVADILNGSEITAPPINAEFNQLVAAFNGSTGHSHDGTTGNAPKIDLTTSISGYLPAAHGGIGGKNKFDATSAPATSNDNSEGYAPGSMWENVTDGRVYICVGNTANAAVWRELVTVFSGPKIEPVAHNTIDIGTNTVRFKDLYLQGGSTIAGNSTFAGTLGVSGLSTLDSLTVTNATTLNGAVTIGNSSADLVGFNGRLTTGLVPNTDDNVDLGTSTLEWRNLYLDGTAHIDTLDVDENAGIDGNLSVTGNTTLTGTLGVTGDTTVANLSATGTTTITSGDINSGAMDNTTIGGSTPAAGTFTTLSANTSLTAATADINGGTIDGASVGATTPSTGAFTSLSASGTSTLSTVDINGGAIDGTTIGASSHTTGKFTTLQSTGAATLASVDINGGAIDGTTIGATTTSSGAFTTVSASGGITGDLTGNVTGNVTGNLTGDITGDITGDLTGNVTASSGTSTFNNVTINGGLDMDASSAATITNLTDPTNAQDAATRNYVDTSIANLVDSAPGTLDTLNELAAALDDDPNFSTTITNSIATKLPLAGGTMSGAIAMGTNKITGAGDPTAAQDVSTKNYTDNQDALQLSLTGGTMSGAIAMGSNNITGLATPTANDHATTKLYVDNILGSSTAASASAAAAATSETNAATSETNAANSATAAASSATSAAASLDSFDDRYLGAKATAPTVDNDGDALVIGALYFDTTTDTMKVYGSSGWTAAGSSVNGTSDRQTYTATSGQTVFAATYDAGYVDVYLNGVKLLAGTDFTAVNGTSIVLASGAAANDIVDIVAYGTFVLADHLTETQSDAKYVQQTHTGNVSVTGAITVTDRISGDGSEAAPAFRFTNDTNTGMFPPAGGDALGFSTGGSEAARFDSSGDFLIGTTDKTLYDETSGGLSGFVFRTDGRMYNSRDGGTNAIFNRLTSDGDIVQFRKDGTTVGTIGSNTTGGQPLLDINANTSSNSQMRFTTSGIERVRIDHLGNIGIGVTPKTGGATWQHIQFGGTGNLVSRHSDSVGDAMFANNYYVNGSGVDSYITGGSASRLFLNDNEFRFDTAPSGTADAALTFTSSMKLTAGNLLFGDNTVIGQDTSDGSDNRGLWLCGGASQTVSRGGSVRVYGNEHTDTGDVQIYSGNNAASNITLNAYGSNSTIQFTTNGGSERMRIASDGKIGIGTPNPQALFHVEGTNISAAKSTYSAFMFEDDDAHIDISSNEDGSWGSAILLKSHASNGDHNNTWAIARNTNAGGNHLNFNYGTSNDHNIGNIVARLNTSGDWLIDGGIYLSGDTAAANKLDDYEEGTWTPTLKGQTSAGTASYTHRVGYYTKVGNIVQISCTIACTGITGTGDLTIDGLPFNTGSANIDSVFSLQWNNATWSGPTAEKQTVIPMLYQTNGTKLGFRASDYRSSYNHAQVKLIGSGSIAYMRITGTYRVGTS